MLAAHLLSLLIAVLLSPCLAASRVEAATPTKTGLFNVSVVTWNLAETAPTADRLRFLGEHSSADIVVLGVQECENVKPRRHEGHRSRAWRAAQKKYFGKGFVALAQHKMGGLQVSVFVRRGLSKKVQGVQVLDVACGVGNVLTNKGAVCVLLRAQGKTIAFVNGHFAAHQSKVNERNQDYQRVTESVVSRAQRRWLHKKFVLQQPIRKASPVVPKRRTAMEVLRSQPVLRDVLGSAALSVEVDDNASDRRGKKRRGKRARRPRRSAAVEKSVSRPLVEEESAGQLKWPFDGVVFLGDLNYRLDLPRLEVTQLSTNTTSPVDNQVEIVKERCSRESDRAAGAMEVPEEFMPEVRAMLRHDQLRRQIVAGKVFHGFKEADITFWPTFKYDRGSFEFDSSGKNRAPSWTDRILYYNFNEGGASESSRPALELTRYFSVDCRHGDHRPVCALFNLSL